MFMPHPAHARKGCLGDTWARESPGLCHCSSKCHLRVLEVLMALKCIFQIFSELITVCHSRGAQCLPRHTSPTWDSRAGTPGWHRHHREHSSAVLLMSRREPESSLSHLSPTTISLSRLSPHLWWNGDGCELPSPRLEQMRREQGTLKSQGSDSQCLAPRALVCLSPEILSPASRNV